MKPSPRARPPGAGLARALSKLGCCSRSQARQAIAAGRVRVNGQVQRDPEWRVDLARDRLELDRRQVEPAARVYLMLNKPRGLVTTAADEQGRPTVYACFAADHLPFLSPVGRLDQASEGLLLFTNDTPWAARLTAPASHLDKTYHVQVNGLVAGSLLRRMEAGVEAAGELLRVKRVALLRHGQRNCWLEIVLDEGKNRHIRRLLAALGLEVLRLVRVAIGPLILGDLPKGKYRQLNPREVEALGGYAPYCGHGANGRSGQPV